MNNRRKLLIGLGAASIMRTVSAQQQRKLYRIGYLSGRGSFERQDDAFRSRLRELGYVEGKNLVIEWRFNKGQNDLNRELVAELLGFKVDCIVTGGVSLTRAAKQATDRIPIVMTTIDGDPVELGFVASLARPGGNVTGFTGIAYDLAGKRLELLKDLLPKATRVGVLLPGDPDAKGAGAAQAHFRGTEAVARKLGMKAQALAARDPIELESMIGALRDNAPHVLSVVGIGWINSHRARLINLIAQLKLPAIYSNDSFVPIGGLISYAADQAHQYGEAAAYVAKILAGAKPAELPVQQPTKFELAINLKTAKALGITIPRTILVRADKVIE